MKYIKIVLKVFVIIIGVIFSILLIDYGKIIVNYNLGKDKYKETFEVQGIKNKYSPQGLTYSDKYNVALQTSYNKKGKVSMLFVTNLSNNKLIKSLKILNSDGSNDTKHVGGITTDGDKVWITNNYTVDILDLNEIVSTKEDSIKIKDSYKLPNRGDFTLYDDGILWIGDFYLKFIYDCPDDTPLLFGYIIDDDYNYDSPDYVIALPKMIQGMARDKKGRFIFTDSYSTVIQSKLTIYSNVLEGNATTYKINGKEIPYYKLDKTNLEESYKLPPMAEGMFLKDEDVYILFESCSDVYWEALPRIHKVLKYNIKKIGNYY